jgi:hypothetical protein
MFYLYVFVAGPNKHDSCSDSCSRGYSNKFTSDIELVLIVARGLEGQTSPFNICPTTIDMVMWFLYVAAAAVSSWPNGSRVVARFSCAL